MADVSLGDDDDFGATSDLMSGRVAGPPMVVRVGDRRFEVPDEFDQLLKLEQVLDDESAAGHLYVKCRIEDGSIRIVAASIEMVDTLEPKDLARIPWRKVVMWAAESRAAMTPTDRGMVGDELDALHRRAIGQRSRLDRLGNTRESRTRMSDERLDEVLALRTEAEALGKPYAAYVADKLGYSTAYVRRLAKMARDRPSR